MNIRNCPPLRGGFYVIHNLGLARQIFQSYNIRDDHNLKHMLISQRAKDKVIKLLGATAIIYAYLAIPVGVFLYIVFK